MAVTDDQIKEWLAANPNASDDQIKTAMSKNNVSVSQFAAATGSNEAEAQKRFESASTILNQGSAPGVLAPGSTMDEETRKLLLQIAGGQAAVPGAGMPAVRTDTTNTYSATAQQVASTAPIEAGQATAEEIEASLVADAQTAAQANPIATSTIENIAEVGDAAPTQSATGTVSEDAVAKVDFQASAGTQSEAAVVTPEPGSEVTAVVGTMPPEAIIEAAKIAGQDTARIERAKTQLRKAGLTEEQIAQMGNDPSSLELRLTDFTDEQRGVIAGLPEEALVSTQMEQLLAGIENGDIPPWAKPAVASVEAMLSRRGLSASTVGRDSLVNAIIQASIPIAQSNATAIKESVLQQRSLDAQTAIAQAELKQQAILQNAQMAFNLNIRNLDAEQQASLANSQFMQTVSLQNASNRQQTAIQNAVNLTNLDMATLDSNTRMAVENAKSFLQMDLTNLNNEQQALLIDSQFQQQKLLSNAAAENAAKQFNASSENQTNQFMASLKANIDQFNASQVNAIQQFNAAEKNKVSATNAGNSLAVEQFNAQLKAQVSQFNAEQEAKVRQWNAANAQAIEQSNLAWRRQANAADTAAQNAINQQNVQNAFALTQQAQAALWQEMRDKATFDFQGEQNSLDREAQLYATAIGNEAAASRNYEQTTHLVNLAKSFFAGG